MKFTRRNFIQGVGAAGVSTFVPHFSFSVSAQESNASSTIDTSEGYKALVCIFFKGGNDFFHQVIPENKIVKVDGKDVNFYQNYQVRRGTIATTTDMTLATTGSDNESLRDKNGNKLLFHKNLMAPLDKLFSDKRANVVLNVGPLIKPLEGTDFDDSLPTNLPLYLYAHNKQQELWQTSFVPEYENGEPVFNGKQHEFGWLGRAIEMALELDTGPINTNTFHTGPNSLMEAENRNSFYINRDGFVQLHATSRPYTQTHYLNISTPELDGYKEDYKASPIAYAYSKVMNQAASTSMDLGDAFISEGFDPEFDTSSSLGEQLRAVKQIINMQDRVNNNERQVFFVEMGGFDTHANQAEVQSALMTEFATEIAAFYRELDADAPSGQVNEDVMTCTLSEFGRTMHSNARGGTDHGWGGGQFMFGPNVFDEDDTDNSKCFGSYPDFAENSSDDNRKGRLVPNISHEQYAAYMLKWIGLREEQIGIIFPSLTNFDTKVMSS